MIWRFRHKDILPSPMGKCQIICEYSFHDMQRRNISKLFLEEDETFDPYANVKTILANFDLPANSYHVKYERHDQIVFEFNCEDSWLLVKMALDI